MPTATLKEKTRTHEQTGGALIGASALLFAGGLIALAASGACDTPSLLITAGLCAALFAAALFARGTVFAPIPALCLCAVGSYVCIQLFSLGAFSWFTESGTPLHLFGALWVLALYLALHALTGSIRASSIAGGAVCALFGIANYALTLFRGRPFLAIDITSIRTAMNVTGSYELSITPLFALAAMLAAAAALAGFALGDPPPERPRWHKWAARGASALLAGTYAYLALCTYMITNTGIFVLWDENQYAESAVMYFAITTEKLSVSEPEGYGDQALEAIAGEIKAGETPGGSAYAEEKPNIIVVMNESFSDLATVGGFDTSVPIAPFVGSLTENTIKGRAYSSVLGGNTANSEYEFLTGDTMAFVPTGTVPYQLYVNNDTDTLVSALEAQGYSSAAMHPYLSSGWNRVQVYNRFGFDKVMFKDDFTDRSYLRNYVTDECDYENVIAQYEENRDGGQQFIFNITMQNHGGYTFEGFEPTVSILGHEGEFPKAEQYLSLINISDAATEELVDYFAAEEEPTVILFFGDHQPNLEDEFYAAAGLKSGGGAEETEKRYSTPFFIWANYDIPEAEGLNVSINYLSSLLMDAAGLEKTGYQTFLGKLSESWPVINSQGALSADGSWHSLYDPVFADSEGARDYRILQYNHLFDPSGLREDIFGLDPEG